MILDAHTLAEPPPPSALISITSLPNETLLDIFSFINPPSCTEYYFFMVELPAVCRDWYNLLKRTESGNYFYRIVFNNLFSWRRLAYLSNDHHHSNQYETQNFKILDQHDDDDHNQRNWYEELKKQVLVFKKCELSIRHVENQSAYTLRADRHLSFNDLVALKQTIGSDVVLIQCPIRSSAHERACFYFECVCTENRKEADNVFLGVAIRPTSIMKHDDVSQMTYSLSGYLGSTHSSFGYYYINGDLYYGGSVKTRSFGSQVDINDKLGIYIDSHKMQFAFFKNRKLVGKMVDMLPLFGETATSQFENGEIEFYPAFSMLYDRDCMHVKCMDICSFRGCKWLKEEVEMLELTETKK
ncbi:hypothetical protein C9374_010737 [Naegleria lovaniensis]|uniref:F-box domain-containing protein n=1 Tax=Naegleria lovaniensis TaxID=51637 RepID=A0AA88GFX1_NAELO|nr:uncharacterized protein C9374_010737 [Naegleria lovaniensis]KAG2374453.1 hypothetical protein C9374_010737 [Naegleria lovaniensis]